VLCQQQSQLCTGKSTLVNPIITNKIGLDSEELKLLAKEGERAHKTSRRDLAMVLADKDALGATTVAATSLIAAMAGIRVFVTGGIGGVHRGYENSTFSS
jgi:pseudouridine-5'-phosphate glycosidase